MATKIEWTDETLNPIRARSIESGKVGWHCELVSPGCQRCYAQSMNRRLGTKLDYTRRSRDEVELYLDEHMLSAPLRWRKPRRVFVCSMTDLFADFVTDEWIDQVFAVMALAPQHTFQVLTKRAKRMREYMEARDWGDAANAIHDQHIRRLDGVMYFMGEIVPPLPNVWLGISAEDQKRLDERAPQLIKTTAAARFLSIEPMLGPIDASIYLYSGWTEPPYDDVINWVIVGGESGPGARPMHPVWARSIRDQCVEAGVPFFFKQWGEWADWDSTSPEESKPKRTTVDGYPMRRLGKKAAGRELDGRVWDEMPQETRGNP